LSASAVRRLLQRPGRARAAARVADV